MKEILIKGKSVVKGKAEGEALVTKSSMQFFGSVDINTGIVMMPKDHELFGKSVSGKILIFSSQVGSTAEPIGYYILKKTGVGPKAIVCGTKGQLPVVSSIVGGTPFIYDLNKDPVKSIKTGDYVKVDGDKGVIHVIRR